MVGANLPNSLQPMYTEALALDPFTQSALFSTYIGAMTVLLVVVAMWRGSLNSRTLLVLALCASLASSLCMLGATHMLEYIFAARLLSGIALGLGTGSASALALEWLGERARTAVATGAVLGSLIGNAGAGAIATLFPAPTVLTYVLHATLICIVLILVVTMRGTAPDESQEISADDSAPETPYLPRHFVSAYVIGGLAWLASGLVLALIPSIVRGAIPNISLLGAIAPAALLLGVGSLTQTLISQHVLWMRAWHVVIPLTLGLTVFSLAITLESMTVMLIAGMLTGLGQGPAYSLGLATVTHGLGPNEQRRRTSRYAAFSYGSCAVGVTLFGAIAQYTDEAYAFFLAAALTLLLGGIAVIAAGARQEYS